MKNRALNYRVTLNEKRDYDVTTSLVTSSESALERWRARNNSRINGKQASSMKRRGVLKAVHLDQVCQYESNNVKDNDHDQYVYEKNENENEKMNVSGCLHLSSKTSIALSTVSSIQKEHGQRQTPGRHLPLPQRRQPHGLETSYHYGEEKDYRRRHQLSSPSKSASRILHTTIGPRPTVSTKVGLGRKPSQSPPDQMLKPTSQIHHANHQVQDRQRSASLNGADLYVARFRVTQDDGPSKGNRTTLATIDDSDSPSTTSEVSTDSVLPPQSLHDELTNPHPSPDKRHSTINVHEASNRRMTAHASRPCYRCIALMHKVGIKRVFWTNNRGEWEGAKVQSLIDLLEQQDGQMADVYATKHEVLMMRRTMGFQ